MRYRFYRVHKYVCYMMSEFERLVAKANFDVESELEQVKQAYAELEGMLIGHAKFEDEVIHEILRAKGSSIQMTAEEEHTSHEDAFKRMRSLINELERTKDNQSKIDLGNKFYMTYRLFYAELLKHLHLEETLLMDEMHRICTDDELKAIQAKTYAKMSPDQMLGMLKVVFPHINQSDKLFFLNEIQEAEPEKFELVKQGLSLEEYA